MAEEVSYASVAFKTKKHSPPETNKEEETVYSEVKKRSKTTESTADTNANKEEETVYSEVKKRSKTTESTADTNGLLPDKKTNSRGRRYQLVACCLGILCVILLLSVIAVCVYKNQELKTQNQQLKTQNQQLETQNQELETQRKNLTEQIYNNFNELNVSRAQWSIDAYCPKQNQNRQCKACQAGWIHSESSCYAINDANGRDLKTWEEAREDCRGKISDLVVKFDQKQTEYVNFNWGELGYWIGLRVEAGNWTWINGTSLQTPGFFKEPPSAEAGCAISIGGKPSNQRKAVKCDEKHRWICEKKALSV